MSSYIQQFDEDDNNRVLSPEELIRREWHGTKYEDQGKLKQFFLTWLSPLSKLGKNYNLIIEDVPITNPLCQSAVVIPMFNEHLHGVLNKQKAQEVAQEDTKSQQDKSKKDYTPMPLRNHLDSYKSFKELQKQEQQEQQRNGNNNNTNKNMMNEDAIFQNHPAVHTSNDDYKNNINRATKEVSMITPFLQFFWICRWTYFRTIIADVLFYGATLTQPYCMKFLSQYFMDPANKNDNTLYGVMLALLLGLFSSLTALATMWKTQHQVLLSTRITSSMLSAIFAKALRIAPYSIAADPDLSNGTVANLISTDAASIERFSGFANLLVTGPLCIVVCLIMMCIEFGPWVTGVALTLVLLLLPLQTALATITGYYRKKVLRQTDQRIKQSTQFMNSLRIIKAYAYERIFEKKLLDKREHELQELFKSVLWLWSSEIVGAIFPLMITLASTCMYVYLHADTFDYSVIFSIFTYLNVVRVPVNFYSYCINNFVDFKISAQRVANFLAKEELPVSEDTLDITTNYNNINNINNNTQQQQSTDQRIQNYNNNNNEVVVALNNVDFYFSSFEQLPQQIPVLSNINLNIKKGETYAVIGASGQGKSALLQSVVGELYPQEYHHFNGLYNINNFNFKTQEENQLARTNYPTLENDNCAFSFNNTIDIAPKRLTSIKGRIGYCSQYNQALFNDTIRNNIILQQPYNREIFLQCIEASGMLPDLLSMVDGDLTLVSESGASLSGGQRARVTFASVLYHALMNAIDIVLLDDIFASVDNDIAKIMFHKGVVGLLQKRMNKTIIMTLNSHYQFLQNADKVVLIDTIPREKDAFYYKLHQYILKHNQQQQQQQNDDKTLLLSMKDTNNKKVRSSDDDDDDDDADGTTDINSLGTKNNQNQQQQQQQNQKKTTTTTTTTIVNADAIPKANGSGYEFGFRQPSGIAWIGSFEEMLDAQLPLLQAYTFSVTNSDAATYSALTERLEDFSSEYKTIGIIDRKKEKEQLDKTKHKIENGIIGKQEGYYDDNNGEEEDDDDDNEQEGNGSSNNNKVAVPNGAPSQANVDWSLYLYWVKGTRDDFGCYVLIATLLFLLGAAVSCRVFVDWWLVNWANEMQTWSTDTTGTAVKHSIGWWVGTTSLAIVIAAIVFFIQIAMFVYTQCDGARQIFRLLINRLFRSGITTYLDVTPMGSIISLLTRDQSTCDTSLPQAIVYLSQQVALQCGTIGLSLIASPIFVLPLIPMAFVVYHHYHAFYNCSVQLRRLETASFAPLSGLFATLQRTATAIRCFGYQDSFHNKFKQYCDLYMNSKMTAYYLEAKFSFDLNLLSTAYMTVLALGVVLLRNYIDTSLGLLAVTLSLRTLQTITTIVRMQTSSSRQMTSLQRIRQLEFIPQEDELDSTPEQLDALTLKQPKEYQQIYYNYTTQYLRRKYKSPEQFKTDMTYHTQDNHIVDLSLREENIQRTKFWPWRGRVEYKNISVRYRNDLPIVLNNVSFCIEPGQSVAIVGPSGCGKSTMLLSFFRMIKPCAGSIEIDGVNIYDLGLADLRSRLSLIPQFPILFSATIRENVDICYQYTDDEILYALKLSGMERCVEECGGLYAMVEENGMNFSASERQLLCISRALLTQIHRTKHQNENQQQQQQQQQQQNINNNQDSLTLSSLPIGSILFGDELSSFTDISTDALIQSTIASSFESSTKFIIAHRISSIITNSRVLVLKRLTPEEINCNISSVAEFDVPFILLNNPQSMFFKMCLAAGIENFISLYNQAQIAFIDIQRKELELYNNIIQSPKELIDLELLIQKYNTIIPTIIAEQQQQQEESNPLNLIIPGLGGREESRDELVRTLSTLSSKSIKTKTKTTKKVKLLNNNSNNNLELITSQSNNNIFDNNNIQQDDFTNLTSPDPFAPTTSIIDNTGNNNINNNNNNNDYA